MERMSIIYVRTTPPSFRKLGSFRETSLSLLKVNDIPNRAEVLRERLNELLKGSGDGRTYVGFDVFILAYGQR